MTNLLSNIKKMLYSINQSGITMKMNIEYRYCNFEDGDFIAGKYIFIDGDNERHEFSGLTQCIEFLEGYM